MSRAGHDPECSRYAPCDACKAAQMPTLRIRQQLPSGAVTYHDGWTLGMLGNALAAGLRVTAVPDEEGR